MRRAVFVIALGGMSLFGMTRAGAAVFTPPAPLDFGSVAVGATSASMSITIESTPGPSAPGAIANVALVPGSPFAITSTSCNATPPPSSCQVTMTFAPVGSGAASGTLNGNEVNLATGGSTAFTYALTGAGTAPPPVLPEAPDARLLPLVAAALFGVSFWILRRRATAAVDGRSAS